MNLAETSDNLVTGKTYVLYHDPCNDGFTAAWAAWKHFGDSAEYVPFTWGQGLGPNKNDDDPGFEANSTIFFVDCAPNPKLLAKLKSHDVTIIDHHKSSWLDYGSPKWGEIRDIGGTYTNPQNFHSFYFDMDYSGSMLTWNYFHVKNGEQAYETPSLIRHVQDRDLWRFALPNTKEIHAFMGCFPKTFGAWDEIEFAIRGEGTTAYNDFVEFGKAVLQRDKMEVEYLRVKGKHCRYVGGYLVPVVNASKNFTSDVCERLLRDYPDAKFAVCYWDRGDGRREWGLRSRGDFDVSEIARLYDGGGHKAAAGFTTSHNDNLELKDRVGGIKLG